MLDSIDSIYRARQKKYPPKEFVEFFKNYRGYDINSTHWLHIQLSVKVQSFITLSIELIKLRCF